MKSTTRRININLTEKEDEKLKNLLWNYNIHTGVLADNRITEAEIVRFAINHLYKDTKEGRIWMEIDNKTEHQKLKDNNGSGFKKNRQGKEI